MALVTARFFHAMQFFGTKITFPTMESEQPSREGVSPLRPPEADVFNGKIFSQSADKLQGGPQGMLYLQSFPQKTGVALST